MLCLKGGISSGSSCAMPCLARSAGGRQAFGYEFPGCFSCLPPPPLEASVGCGGETLPVPSALGIGEEAACLVLVVLSDALPGSLPPLKGIKL